MENDKIWHKITNLLKTHISPGYFQTFFKGAGIKSLDEENITIFTPSAFHLENIKSRFLPLVENAIKQVLGKKIDISFTVDSTKLAKKNSEDLPDDLFQTTTYQPTTVINPKYTLENFVVGLSNNVAYAAAQAVVQNPGTSYNPLFIYGGTGVGKTHLMLGIGNALLSKSPHLKVIYCSSEKFMNDYVSAIQEHKMGDLRSKYRSTNLLLIDDIQFFSGREGTQEEFFHTFNELQSKNAQMVITSDRTPNEIAKIEDRLKSRFAGGLMIDIQPPDFDTRVAILQAKCQERGENLPEEVLKLLASSLEINIRELEGKLIQILQTLHAQNLEPTIQNISGFLQNSSMQKTTQFDQKKVLSTICGYFDLSTKDLTGPKRQKELVLPRHIVMFLLCEELNMTVQRVGQILGGRDHTTVMHGRDRVKKLLSSDRDIQRIFIELKQKLTS